MIKMSQSASAKFSLECCKKGVIKVQDWKDPFLNTFNISQDWTDSVSNRVIRKVLTGDAVSFYLTPLNRCPSIHPFVRQNQLWAGRARLWQPNQQGAEFLVPIWCYMKKSHCKLVKKNISQSCLQNFLV